MKKTLSNTGQSRDGAIVPLFAILLPVLLVLSAFAINMAYMQLTTTELRITSDVASHAGGRALNVFQNMDNPTASDVIDQLQQTVDTYYSMNTVAGQHLTPPGTNYIEFYNLGARRDRLEDSFYDQNVVSESAARAGTPFNGVGVTANVDVPHLFDFKYGGGSLGNFAPSRNSITRQVERDLAIVIDKSGSMLSYKDGNDLRSVLWDMYVQSYITYSQYRIAAGYQTGHVTGTGRRYFRERNRGTVVYYPRFLVPWEHYENINGNWRWFTQGFDVIDKMEQFHNNNPGDSREIESMLRYMKSWEGVEGQNGIYSHTGNRKGNPNSTYLFTTDSWIRSGMFNDHAPAESRWDYLYRGIQDFTAVLEKTPAEEKISLVVFDNVATAPVALTHDYQAVLDEVASIIPNSGTSIHEGMREGLERVLQEDASRPFTEKFIVVMTDGENNQRGVVVPEARAVKSQHPEMTIHTLTFGDGTGLSPNPNYPGNGESRWSGEMVDVAKVGGGEHFHADEAEELQQKLKEIANIQPTIFTY